MEDKPIEKRPWFVGTICVVALLVTWASYFAVYEVLPQGTPLAHWGLFALALGSTAGLIITLERVAGGPLRARLTALDRKAG